MADQCKPFCDPNGVKVGIEDTRGFDGVLFVTHCKKCGHRQRLMMNLTDAKNKEREHKELIEQIRNDERFS